MHKKPPSFYICVHTTYLYIVDILMLPIKFLTPKFYFQISLIYGHIT